MSNYVDYFIAPHCAFVWCCLLCAVLCCVVLCCVVLCVVCCFCCWEIESMPIYFTYSRGHSQDPQPLAHSVCSFSVLAVYVP